MGSETKWTPEPWQLVSDDLAIIVGPRDDCGERPLVAGPIAEIRRAFTATPPPLPETERRANAARIVACVNACTGIPDPGAELWRLRAIEAASEQACLIAETMASDFPGASKVARVLRTALARHGQGGEK